MINFHIITIFPKQIKSFVKEGIFRIALEKKLVNISIYNLREWGIGKHKRVDDRPFGGGPGMILMPEPIFNVVEQIKYNNDGFHFVFAMAPSGKKFRQKDAYELASFAQNEKDSHFIVLCGHYEGFDQRILDNIVDKQISIGEFVVSGGEIPALAFMDAIIRLIPGVLGNEKSLLSETYNKDGENDYPNWTRPSNFRGMKVPEILISGDHAKIDYWRRLNKVLIKSDRP